MKNVLLVIVIAVLALVGFIATRPAQFHIERSATMSADPGVVFANVADFHRWEAWSPWEHIDPAMQKKFDGAESGAGAIYSWTGNDKVGEGRMTLTDAVPGEHVGIKLEFIKPFQATNTCTFALAPEAGGTHVTWSMDGSNNFMAKAASLFMNMDKTVGADFEKGLASLKQVAEAVPASVDSLAAPPAN